MLGFDGPEFARWKPLGGLDGGLCPQTDPRELQGRARLIVSDGWTALSFWDRTVDDRYASNAAFLAQGEHSFSDMIQIAAGSYPREYARITEAAPIALAP